MSARRPVAADRDSAQVLGLDVKQDAQAKYSIEYLLNTSKAVASASDSVVCEYSAKKPLSSSSTEQQGSRIHLFWRPASAATDRQAGVDGRRGESCPTAMPGRRFKKITVTEQLYQQVSERAKKENKKDGDLRERDPRDHALRRGHVPNYVPFLELVSLDNE